MLNHCIVQPIKIKVSTGICYDTVPQYEDNRVMAIHNEVRNKDCE